MSRTIDVTYVLRPVSSAYADQHSDITGFDRWDEDLPEGTRPRSPHRVTGARPRIVMSSAGDHPRGDRAEHLVDGPAVPGGAVVVALLGRGADAVLVVDVGQPHVLR